MPLYEPRRKTDDMYYYPTPGPIVQPIVSYQLKKAANSSYSPMTDLLLVTVPYLIALGVYAYYASKDRRHLDGADQTLANVQTQHNVTLEAEELAKRMEEAVLAKRADELVRAEREDSQRIHEEAEWAMIATREEVERALNAVEQQRREAEVGEVLAEQMALTAAEETRMAMKAKEEAERGLQEGIQPMVTPSPEEVVAAKQRIQFKEGCFHFAVAGISGSGKSSLLNAFRGLRGRDSGAAPVGDIETTLQMTRYADANPETSFVWYDLPGAGTLGCHDWQYFNSQCLYIFDCIIVLFDNRFTLTDIAILANARRFNIPTYIVRSKADQHIRNTMVDMGYSEGDEGNSKRRNKLYQAARQRFVEETRRSVQINLEDANLPDQRVYIVSDTTLLNIVLKKMPKKTIDEADLLKDLISEARRKWGADRKVK